MLSCRSESTPKDGEKLQVDHHPNKLKHHAPFFSLQEPQLTQLKVKWSIFSRTMFHVDGFTPLTSCSIADVHQTHALSWMPQPQDSQPETKTSTVGRQTINCPSRISNEYPDQNPHSKHKSVKIPPLTNTNRECTEAYNSQLSNKINREQAYLTDWYKKCKSSFSGFSRTNPQGKCASSLPCTSTLNATETQSNIITVNDLYRNQEIRNRTGRECESHHEKLPSFHHEFVKESIRYCLPINNDCVTEYKKRRISSDNYPPLKSAVFDQWSNPNQAHEIQATMMNNGDACLDTLSIKSEQNFDTNKSICELNSHYGRNQAQTCEMYQYSLDNKNLESCTKSYRNNQGNLNIESADSPSNYADSKCFYNHASIFNPEQYARNSIFNFAYQYPLSVWEYYLLIERELCVRVSQISLPLLVTHVYNPLDYAFEMHCDFVQKFCNSQRPVLFLGMNPGPFGMSQTGVPFGEVDIVKSWLHVTGDVHRPLREHPKRPILGLDCRRKEVSGNRFWNFIKRRSGSPNHFFKSCFVHNLLPLAFMSESGKNVTVPQLPAATAKTINEACDTALCQVVKLLDVKVIIGVGKFAQKRASIALKQGEITEVRIETIMHPSPRNPAANQGWEAVVTKQLQEMDALKYLPCNESVF